MFFNEPKWILKRGLELGYGVYEWADGRVYTGKWKKNKMHEEGTLYWPDDRKYKGEEKNLKAAWIFHYGHAEF